MLEALVCWGLALYGAMMIVWQMATHIRRNLHHEHPRPVFFVLIVQDAEEHIEGLLRNLFLQTANGVQLQSIHVLDLSNNRETEDIVLRLAERNSYLTYQRILSDTQLEHALKQVCMNSSAISCVYDLRAYDMIEDMSHNLAWLCR